jgi:hypothetical protein
MRNRFTVFVLVTLIGVAATGASELDRLQAGVRDCQAREREFRTMAALTKCYLDAEYDARSRSYPYPDLLRLEHAERLANAHRFDRKEIGLEEMQLGDARISARIATEAQRRANEERAARALERASRRDPVVGSPPESRSGTVHCQTVRSGNSLNTVCH